jgi:hypothetical protein
LVLEMKISTTHTHTLINTILDLLIWKYWNMHIKTTAHQDVASVSNILTHLCPILPSVHTHFPFQCAKLESLAEIKWTRTIKTQLQYILQLTYMLNRIPQSSLCTNCVLPSVHFPFFQSASILGVILHNWIHCDLHETGTAENREMK